MQIQSQAIRRREAIRNNLKQLKIVPNTVDKILQNVDNPEVNSGLKKKTSAQKQPQIVMIKDVFEKKFQTCEKLGEGFQSVVRRARSKIDGKSYAVKIMQNMDEERIHHTKQEFKIVQSLDLPTIAKVHEMYVSATESECRIIMEYCPMPQLRQLLCRFLRLNEDLVSQIIKTLLETVDFLHSKNICHRDIKPENILYDEDTGELKLLDFNVATQCYRQMLSVTGTIFYKAPEMFESSYTNKVDIWAIGVVAYELLHGKLPFSHENVAETIREICQTDIDSLISPDITGFSRDFLKRCLSKNPKTRPSAKEALKEPFILLASKKSPLTPKGYDFHNNSFDGSEMDQQTKEPDLWDSGWSPEKKSRRKASFVDFLNPKQAFYLDKSFGINLIQHGSN